MARETTYPKVVDAETRGEAQRRVVMIAASRSAAAEQYRVLARKLERKIQAGPKRIAITSATAGEGRSTTAVNLALALGVGGRQRVALVDAHLRAPAVHALLGLSPQGGLVDVVTERAPLDQVLWRFGDEELYVLPAGRSAEPHTLFASRRLRAVLDELRDRFDVVILDAPPVLPTADMLSLLDAVDATVMVVKAGGPSRELVSLAIETIAHVPLLGCVLAGVDAAAAAPFGLYARHDRAMLALPAPRERDPAPALAGGVEG